jgi:F0F1-type ATP synthase delta subunit
MSIQLTSVTAPKILELIEQFLTETEQQWLNQQLNQLLQKPDVSLAQKQRLIDQLCGSWAEDESLGPIFATIEQQRALNTLREVSF